MVFGKECTTELAPLQQKEITSNNIENKCLTLRIFIDHSKAFDRLSHKVLLEKYIFMDFEGIPFL